MATKVYDLKRQNFTTCPGTKIFAQFEYVYPEKAKAFLEMNHPNNRKLKENDVEKYKREMLNDHFVVTGDTIKFMANGGYLIDGQHRLNAIINSNKPQICLVVRNLPDEALDVVDGGISRTIIDQFVISGKKDAVYTNKKSSALCRAIALETGIMKFEDKLSSMEMGMLIDKYKNLCRFAIAFSGKGGLPAVPMSYAMLTALSHGEPEEKVRAFIKCFSSGEVNNNLLNVNWSAVNKIKEQYWQGKFTKGGSAARQIIMRKEFAKAFYLFSKNVRRTAIDDCYPADEKMLKELNDRFVCESFKEPWFEEEI